MKTITNYDISIILILGIFLSLLPATNHIHAQEAQIWKKYTGAIHDPNIPLLPDYGYAGYQLGTQAIPETFSHPVFDVTDYGAVPNDANSDQAAIQAAIDAAEANGSGIVFFPPGEFLVNTDPNTTISITIESSDIILKGSGSAPGGTVINMKNHMLLPSGNPIWAVPPMIDFTFPWSASATGLLTQDADRGSDFITVQDARLFQGWKYCRMDMPATTAANSQFLEGKTPRSIWSKINNEGVSLIEFHEIESVDVDNNRVYFKDPIVDDMKVAHGWKARGFDMMEGSGFEDIHFKANFLDNFAHHKDYIHNAGWNAIKMSRVAHCWVRRSRFTNVTGVVSLGHAYASSMIMLLIDGNRGHTLTSAGGSTRILQGLIWDNTNKGQWHGPNMSGSASGSVVWRIEAIKGRGFDLHGSFPRTNLIDLYTSVEVTGNGGAYQNLPNHLSGLTIWNQKRVGGNLTSPYNFWENCGGNYCGIAIVDPIVVGYHGSATTFVQSNVKYEESNGTKVLPASLYEAQVEHRLGARPAWMDGAIAKYDSLKSEWYGVDPMPLQTEKPASGLIDKTGFNVYPNPFYSTINIQFREYHTVSRISLTDINGKIIVDQPIDEVEKYEIVIDQGVLSQGWYFLKVVEADRVHTFKLSKLLK